MYLVVRSLKHQNEKVVGIHRDLMLLAICLYLILFV